MLSLLFFGTSRSATAKRLVEIGYDEARGMLKYANGKPVQGYLVEKTVADNQTYTLDFDKLVDEYQRNEKLRLALDKGDYIYVDGHLCLRDSKYVWWGNNKPFLTTYARTHMAECCLLFTVRHENEDYEYIPGSLNFNAKKPGKLSYLYNLSDKGTQVKSDIDEIEASVKLLETCPQSFAGTLSGHMDNLGFSNFSLARVSMLSERTIARMRNEKAKKSPSMESIIAAGIGMKLYPELILDMLEKANRPFDPQCREHMWYKVIIRTMYFESVDKVNSCLKSHGIRPLVAEEGEFGQEAQ